MASSRRNSTMDNQRRSRASEYKPGRRSSLLRKASSDMLLPKSAGIGHSELDETDLQKAVDYMKEHMPAGGEKRIFPISHLDEFGEWGIGTQLYFQFTYMFMKVSGCMALLFLPQLICNLSGNFLESLYDETFSNTFLMVLSDGMIPNFGTLVKTNVTTGNKTMGTNGRNFTMFGSGTGVEDMTFYFATFDTIASILFFSFCVWFEYIHIPSVVLAHRNENVSVETYALFIDCLPRRVDGDDGMESYAARLKNHFELLLAAQLTGKSARKGTTVIAVDDEGSTVESNPWFGLSFCPRRLSDGYDARGRRLGRIVKMGKSGKETWVQWTRGKSRNDQSPKTPEKYLVSNGEEHGELLDAYLLWRIEGAGLNIWQPSDDPENKKECCVYNVDLMRDFQGHLGDMRHKAKNDDRTLEEKLREQQRQKEAFKRRASGVGTMKSMLFRAASNNSFGDLDTALEEFKMEEREVVGAFVTFNHIKHRDFLFDEYRFTRIAPVRMCGTSARLCFNGTPIRVSEAQAPCDIYWDNLDCPNASRWRRLLVVILCCVAMLGGVVTVVLLAKDRAQTAREDVEEVSTNSRSTAADCAEKGFWSVWNDDPPGLKTDCGEWFNGRVVAGLWEILGATVAVSVIFVSGFFVDVLAQFAKPFTISNAGQITMLMGFLLYVLILGPIRTLLNAQWDTSQLSFGVFGRGKYADLEPEWYLNVGTSIATTLVINTLFPIIAVFQVPFFHLLIHTLKRRQKLMTDLLDLYTPPEFPFALRHAEQLSQFFAVYIYCGGMPILAFFIPLSCFLYYTVDKYTFLRGSKLPPRYTETFMALHVKALQFAVLLHVFFGVEVYSNQKSAPSECIAFCSLEFGNGEEDAIDVQASKYFKKSTVPLTLLALAILCAYGARLTQFILGGNALLRGDHATGQRGGGLNEEESFHNEVAAMKRRGYDTTFSVEDMEGYDFLKDESKREHERELLDALKMAPGGGGQAARGTRASKGEEGGSEAGSAAPEARERQTVMKLGKESLAARHRKSEKQKENKRSAAAAQELGSTARRFEAQLTEKTANGELPLIAGKAAAAKLSQPGKEIAKTKSPKVRDHLDYHHDDDLHLARLRLVTHQDPAVFSAPGLVAPATPGKKLHEQPAFGGHGFRRPPPVVLASHLDVALGPASLGKNLHDPHGLTLGLTSASPRKGGGKGKVRRKGGSRGSRPNSRGASSENAPVPLMQTTIGNAVDDNWG